MCAEKGTFPSTVAASIGLSNAAATGWKNGKQPRQRVINQLAAVLGCAVEDLMEKEKPTVQDDGLAKERAVMLAALDARINDLQGEQDIDTSAVEALLKTPWKAMYEAASDSIKSQFWHTLIKQIRLFPDGRIEVDFN